MGGAYVKMVQMRNPWRGDSGWKGDYSEVKGGVKWANLKAALGDSFKVDAGKYWISWSDFLKEYSSFTVAYSQESRAAGRVHRPEYRPSIKMTSGAAK